MSRPDLHTSLHTQIDLGGYCNNLVLDDDGIATTCGWRASETPVERLDRRIQQLLELAELHGFTAAAEKALSQAWEYGLTAAKLQQSIARPARNPFDN